MLPLHHARRKPKAIGDEPIAFSIILQR